MDIYGVIYCLTNKINGKKYVGQTTLSADCRWRIHVSAARCNKKQCPLLERAIRKYGQDAFNLVIVTTVDSKDLLDTAERQNIISLNSLAPLGYNLKEGGGNGHHSIETRKKISDALKGRLLTEGHKRRIGDAQKGSKNHRFGKHNTDAHKTKCSEALKGKFIGRSLTDATKAKLKTALKGRKLTPDHIKNSADGNRGLKRSSEAKQRMSNAQKDWWAQETEEVLAAKAKIKAAKLAYWSKKRGGK